MPGLPNRAARKHRVLLKRQLFTHHSSPELDSSSRVNSVTWSGLLFHIGPHQPPESSLASALVMEPDSESVSQLDCLPSSVPFVRWYMKGSSLFLSGNTAERRGLFSWVWKKTAGAAFRAHLQYQHLCIPRRVRAVLPAFVLWEGRLSGSEMARGGK